MRDLPNDRIEGVGVKASNKRELRQARARRIRDILSVLLSLAMILQGFPANALAEEFDTQADIEPVEQVDDSEGQEKAEPAAADQVAEAAADDEGQPAEPVADNQSAEPVADNQPAEPVLGAQSAELEANGQAAQATGEEPEAVTVDQRKVAADIKDADGNVRATIEVEGMLPSDAALAVAELDAETAAALATDANEASFAYDVTILSQGAKWHPEDPEAKMTVRVRSAAELPEGARVLHYLADLTDDEGALDADDVEALRGLAGAAEAGSVESEAVDVRTTDDGAYEFQLKGLSPFVAFAPKATKHVLRANAAKGNNTGSGEVDGLEYSWSIKWDTPAAEGQNISNVTYDDNTNSLEFHPSDWTTLSEAVLKVQFHVNPGEGGSGSIPAGAVKFTLPLHAFYDKDNNGTDQSTGYEVLVDHGENLFKHEIVGDQIVITNWQEITSADMSLQISYKVDPLRVPGGRPAEDNADITGDNWWENYTGYYQKTLPASFEMEVGEEKVSEDAPLNIAMKTRAKGTGAAAPMPTKSDGIYLSWDDAWGEKPADADDYIYLVWCLGYGWGHRVDDKTYYGKMSTQGFKTSISALKSDNQVTFGGKTFEGEIIGTDYHDLTGTYPSGSSFNSGTTYMSNYGLAGLYGKTAPDYQKVTTNGYNNKSLEDVLTNGTQGTQDWAGTGGYAVLMRYPKEMIEAAAEELGEDKLKTEGFPVAAKFTVTETWDSGYTTERKVEATPATVVIKKASGAGEFKKHSGSIAGSYKTIPGGQTQLLNDQDVYLNRAGSQSATSHVESWGMTWNGQSFSESVEGGGGNNLGQHIVITDTEDATLLISSRKAKNATTWEPEGQEELSGEAGDYSINGFWITLSEYTGSYDPDYDVWTPSSTSSKEFDKYEPVYIEARKIGGDFEPYCVVRRTGAGARDYEVRQWDGTTEGAVIPRDWGEYALPEDTIQVRAVHDSTDFVHCVLELYVAVIIHPTDHVVGIVRQHVNDDAVTVLKNVASYDVTPATGKEPLVPGGDEYHKTGNNVLPNNATDVFISLNQLSSSLTLSKQAYVPPENNEDQIEANLHDKQVAYVQLQAFTQLDVPQSETVISEVEDPYKLLEGTFYELLPKGVQFDMNSVKVIYDMNFQDQNMGAANYQNVDSQSMRSYRKVVPQENITVTPVYNDATGQTLVKIEYKLEDPGLDYSSPQQNWRCRARCYFKLENSFDNIQSYGRQTLNACAYENTTPGAGHSLDTSQTLTNAALGDQAAAFEDLATNDIISRYSKETISWHSLAYTETSFAKTASAIETVGGVVVDDQFSTEQNVTINNEYKYRLLYKLVDTTQGKDIVFYDILDSGKNSEGQELESDWQGKLVGVDVSAIEEMHNYKDANATCAPVVYYSTTASGKVSSGSTFDLTDGSWTKADEYSGDLAAVKAIAIDCSKDSKGADYVMPPGAALMAFVTMKAPGKLPSSDDPTAVNGAIVRSQTFPVGQTSGSTHTNLGYTKVKLHDVEVGITKDSDPMTGSANDPTKVKPDGNGKITYRLTVHNTSDYDSRNVTLTDVLPEGLTIDDVKVALNGTPEDEATDGDSTTGFSYEFDENSRVLTFNIVRQYVSTDDADRDTHIYINCTVDSLLSADNDGKQVMSRDYVNTATLDEANEKTFDVDSEPTYHRAETMEIPVEKVWKNDANLKHLRPENITVTLTGTYQKATTDPDTGDETTEDATIVDEQATLEDPDWSGSYIDLPKWAIDDADTDYDTPTTAAEITYDLEEVAVDGYDTEITGDASKGYTVINTVKSGDLTVDKEILNGRFLSDYDIGFDFTVELSDKKVNGTFGDMTFENGVASFKLSANQDPVKATGLPQGVKYTVTEKPFTGFDIAKVGDTGTISGTLSEATFTNKTQLMNLEGTKIWSDQAYQGISGYKRPESVTIKAIGEIEGEGGTKITVLELDGIATNADKDWKYAFTGIPVYKGGKKITYRVVEKTVPDGYAATYEGTDVINTPVEKTDVIKPVTLNIVKTDRETGHALAGAYFEAKNEAGGTIASATTDKDGKAALTFDAEGTYTLTETAPTGYTSDPGIWTIVVSKSGVDKVQYDDPNQGVWNWLYHLIFGNEAENFQNGTLSVSNPPVPVDVTAEKVWVDDSDADGMRPSSITFTLYKKVGDAEPKEYKTAELSGQGDTWKTTFKSLPSYEDGKPVTYTVDEESVPVNYEKKVSEDGLTVTNTYTPTTASIVATKSFDAWDKADGFKFTLTKAAGSDDAPLPKTTELTATEDEPTVTFGEIHLTSAGTFKYEVTESNDGVDGVSYDVAPHGATIEVRLDEATNRLKADVSYDDGDAIKITNTFAPAKAQVEVTKEINFWPKDAEFEFELKPVDGAPMPKADEAQEPGGGDAQEPAADNPQEPEGGDAQAPGAASAKATADKPLATFGEIEYDKAGEYKYTLTEVDGGLEGVTYDGKEHQVVVTVTKAEDATNALTATVAYDEQESLTVKNEYHSAGEYKLAATKTLTGTDLTAGMFDFEAVEVADAEGTANEGAEAAKASNAADGSVAFDEVKLTEADFEGEGVVTAEDGTRTIERFYRLSEAIPEGAVQEGSEWVLDQFRADGSLEGSWYYDGSAHVVTVKATDDGRGTITTEVTPEVSFVNAYEPSITPPPEEDDDNPPRYSTEVFGEVSPAAAKRLLDEDGNELALKAGQFSFQLLDKDGKVLSTAKNSADGSVYFKEIDYDADDAGKTFQYKIREAVPAGAKKSGGSYVYGGVSYDSHEVKVSVKVTMTRSGTEEVLDREVTYEGGDVATFTNRKVKSSGTPDNPSRGTTPTTPKRSALAQTSDPFNALLASMLAGAGLVLLANGIRRRRRSS